jgi:hypothetical protein
MEIDQADRAGLERVQAEKRSGENKTAITLDNQALGKVL